MPVPPPLPHLLPQNRRVRHLRGIYLRNLSFTRPRDQSIDDAGLNKSPGKLDALRESHQLQHTRSSESLRPDKPRRRSTNLANASAAERQKMLDLALDSRTCDAFFSLHCPGQDEVPVYISELKERSTNFNFQLFDLTDRNPRITRAPIVTVKVWIKRQGTWSLFIEEEADLRCLSYIQVLPGNYFPPNCLVFHLTDGAYAFGLKNKIVPPKGGESLATSSFNALMRLANIENSIQDALETQEKLTAQVDDILANESPYDVHRAEDDVEQVIKRLDYQKRINKAAEKKCDDLQASIKARRAAIADGRRMQEKASSDVAHAASKLPSSRAAAATTHDNLRGQRRRICEDLLSIYPITPAASGQTLAFAICGLALPNSEYTPLPPGGEDALSAALGAVARLVDALQYYLGVALPYALSARGSRSGVRDDISILPDGVREFPLWVPRGGAAGNAQLRAEYGWFLLNKDVEALCTAQGLKVVDIRHTLPNLKYLLYVCSAGGDELPERKKGGIRGLWAGRMEGRGGSLGLSLAVPGEGGSGGSRRGSAESEALARQVGELRRAVANGKGSSGGGGEGADSVPAAAALPLSPLSNQLPFGEEETKLTLRTKGLRENVGK